MALFRTLALSLCLLVTNVFAGLDCKKIFQRPGFNYPPDHVFRIPRISLADISISFVDGTRRFLAENPEFARAEFYEGRRGDFSVDVAEVEEREIVLGSNDREYVVTRFSVNDPEIELARHPHSDGFHYYAENPHHAYRQRLKGRTGLLYHARIELHPEKPHWILLQLPSGIDADLVDDVLEEIRRRLSLLPRRYIRFLRTLTLSKSASLHTETSAGSITLPWPESGILESADLFLETGYLIGHAHSRSIGLPSGWAEHAMMDGLGVSRLTRAGMLEDFAFAARDYLLSDAGALDLEPLERSRQHRLEFLKALQAKPFCQHPID